MADSPASRKSAVTKSRQAVKGGESDSRKLLLSLVLFVCCCGAGYFTWSTLQLLQGADDALQIVAMPQAPDPAAEVEKGEIATAEEGLNDLSQSSTRAMQTALMAETQSRYPLDQPETLVAKAPIIVQYEPVIEPEPPSLTVVAVMITDTDSAALVSVDGEQDILVRKGTKFSEGTATITKIDAKGVTFTWRRKNYQVTL